MLLGRIHVVLLTTVMTPAAMDTTSLVPCDKVEATCCGRREDVDKEFRTIKMGDVQRRMHALLGVRTRYWAL